jgi:lipoprotein-anchoring transpeptidase ErfK/SrfK
MRSVSFIRQAAKAALATAIFIAAVPGPAQAGFFDLFSSQPTQDSSGRELVVFPAEADPGSIIVSFADRKLYFILPGHRAISYPVGAPMGEASWQGVLHVTEKRINPVWTPTSDMRRENPTLPVSVPGGHPLNPLGPRAMYLGSTTYRIHGTDAPWTVGQDVSHGCIRMYNNDVIDLYDRVPIGTKVVVTWQRFAW